MPVRLRLARFGRRVSLPGSSQWASAASQVHLWHDAALVQNLPFYRIFVADSRAPRDGRHVEVVGHYDPIPGKDGNKHLAVNADRIRCEPMHLPLHPPCINCPSACWPPLHHDHSCCCCNPECVVRL